MLSSTTATQHKARKQHRCTWCWESINPQEVYDRYRYFDGPETGVIKMHPECFQAMKTEAKDDPTGWIEWTPGQERPLGLKPLGRKFEPCLLRV